jgi:hypothetical protein
VTDDQIFYRWTGVSKLEESEGISEKLLQLLSWRESRRSSRSADRRLKTESLIGQSIIILIRINFSMIQNSRILDMDPDDILLSWNLESLIL